MSGVTETGRGEPLSLRAYARHRGTSAPAVLRAVRRGRLHRCLVYDDQGHAKIADVALADQEWAANTDLTMAPTRVKQRAAGQAPRAPGPPAAPDEPDAAEAPAVPPGVGAPGTLSLLEASALEKDWKARLAELEYRRRAGELVPAKDVEARIVEDYSRCKVKLLGLPRKAKARLPHLTHADIVALDDLVREALEDLAGPEATPAVEEVAS